MNVRPHPRYAEFVHRIRILSPSPTHWAGLTFRSVKLEHANPDEILSGEGSRKFGGRWNAPETFPVIYSSTRPGTAVEEAFQLASDYELSPEDLKPRITCGIEWDLARVIDLTQSKLPAWLKLTKWMQETSRESTTVDLKLCARLSAAQRGIR